MVYFGLVRSRRSTLVHLIYSIHFNLLWFIWSIQSILVHFGSFGLTQSILVHFGQVQSIWFTLVKVGMFYICILDSSSA